MAGERSDQFTLLKGRRLWFYVIFLTALVLFLTYEISYLENRAKLNHLLDGKDTLENLRAMEVPLEQYNNFRKWEEKGGNSRYEYMTAYFAAGSTDQEELDWYIRELREYRPKDFLTLTEYLSSVWEDLVYFPIPLSKGAEDIQVSFADSWMFERTFGGTRGHEGTDLMPSENRRGHYPVLSMTDGVVEQIGWLTKGGYRIGIRSPHGGYFYYAHLYDYARDFQPGDSIKAGEWLGFMGDSGYSEVEGTVGNFDVHLHAGIYVNDPDGSEMSVNPYWPLKYLENKKLKYSYE